MRALKELQGDRFKLRPEAVPVKTAPKVVESHDEQQPAPSTEPSIEPAAHSPKIIQFRRRNAENKVLQSEPELVLAVGHHGGVRALAARQEQHR